VAGLSGRVEAFAFGPRNRLASREAETASRGPEYMGLQAQQVALPRVEGSPIQSAACDISVVIPVWGTYAGAPLLEALDSLRGQDAWARIVVVDNASDPALGPFPGVEIVRAQRRLTVGAARNLGLAQVRTPYVLFWDADDLMLPGTLRFLRERISSPPGPIAAAGAILEGDPPTRHRWPRRWAAPLARLPSAFALAHSVWSLFPTTGGTLMLTEAVRAAGGYADADSGEDWVLGVSLAFRGRVELHERPGRLYRRFDGSLWERRRSMRHLLRHAAVVRRRMREDPGVPRWARMLTPGVAVLQIAVLAPHSVARLTRTTLRRWRSRAEQTQAT
jgi:glycosyltransferase involved in cell wall biosynthesis